MEGRGKKKREKKKVKTKRLETRQSKHPLSQSFLLPIENMKIIDTHGLDTQKSSTAFDIQESSEKAKNISSIGQERLGDRKNKRPV